MAVGAVPGTLWVTPAVAQESVYLITISSINISRIKDGKVVEDWTVLDMLGMMQQLGLIPAGATA